MSDGRYHHGNLRRALIEAAESLLSSEGADGVTMRAAARIAGVSSAAPYRHFRDRDELMSAVAARGHERLFAAMAADMAAMGDDGLLRLRAQGLAFVRFALAEPELFRVMHHAPWMARGRSAEMDRFLEAAEGHTEAEAAVARDQGVLADDDGAAQLLACRALVYGLARLFVDGHGEQLGVEPTDELVEGVIDAFARGLLPR